MVVFCSIFGLFLSSFVNFGLIWYFVGGVGCKKKILGLINWNLVVLDRFC